MVPVETFNLNYGQIFFMTLGFIPVLLCLPCWVVAKFVYEPYVKEAAIENQCEFNGRSSI